MPPGQRVYAIGDVHGRLDLLKALLDKIEKDCRENPPQAAALVCLGDYVDRGPYSKQVVRTLIRGLPASFQVTLLKGNHEDLLLSFLRNPYAGLNWLENGGDATLVSYGVPKHLVQDAFRHPDALLEAARAFRMVLPVGHLLFYQSLALYHRVGDYFFVHAGVRPGCALEHQREQDLLWIRSDFLDWPGDYGAVVVHGHTPSRFPENRKNRIGLDTLAYATGRLSAVALEGSKRWFLTT